MIQRQLIKLLFWLLGQNNIGSQKIQYLFGDTKGHEQRRKRWKNALNRLWKDKDLIDYLQYQAEIDKEKVFQGKVDINLSRGARIRTLFLVYQAQMAYLESIRSHRSMASDKTETEHEMKKLSQVYKELADVKL